MALAHFLNISPFIYQKKKKKARGCYIASELVLKCSVLTAPSTCEYEIAKVGFSLPSKLSA